MIYRILPLPFVFLCFPVFSQIDPARYYGQLFYDVQNSRIFEDSKTFTDCIPKANPMKILTEYQIQSSLDDFDLKGFVAAYFEEPQQVNAKFEADTDLSVEQHIEKLWEVLTREPDTQETWTSLLHLPENYIVPGGRFREIYYWDTYFTMLGLAVSGHHDVIKSMLDNFVFLINTYGFIPNGNRTYYLSRSQPPFFALMVELWGRLRGADAKLPYLSALEREHAFWMNGRSSLSTKRRAINHVVLLDDGSVLNRYWDYLPQPRPESFREDYDVAKQSKRNEKDIYTHIRAAAESGWDFSSRWFADGKSMATIHTTDILPVDLNCLLYQLELTISNLHFDLGNHDKGNEYLEYSFNRKNAILKHFWNSELGFFTDYDFVKKRSTRQLTMATAFPMFFSLADRKQARQTTTHMLRELEKPGGLVTTRIVSGEQWDSPNGWPPLQYIGIVALQNYGFNREARRIAGNWLALNDRVFGRTGRMMEKYNVIDIELEAGGGEYPLQDGFGWTNGVYLALKELFR